MKKYYLYHLIMNLIILSLLVSLIIYLFYIYNVSNNLNQGILILLACMFMVFPVTLVFFIMFITSLVKYIKILINKTQDSKDDKKLNPKKEAIKLSIIFSVCCLIIGGYFLLNHIKDIKRFNKITSEMDIKYIDSSDMLYHGYYGDGLAGWDSVDLFYCKIKKDREEEFLSQFSDNINYEKDIVFEEVIVNHSMTYTYWYKNCVPDKYKIDFNKKYYYTNKPLIYYPDTNELIIFYFYCTEDGNNDFNYSIFKTKKDYYESIKNKYLIGAIHYEDMQYFYDDIVNEKQLTYYYFDINNENHEYDQNIINKLNLERKDLDKENELKELLKESKLDNNYNLIYDQECYYKKYSGDYINDSNFVIFYPDIGKVIVISDNHYWKY